MRNQSRGCQPVFDKLSTHERDVVRLNAAGADNAEISRRLNISIGTIKDQIHHTLAKTVMNSCTVLAAALAQDGVSDKLKCGQIHQAMDDVLANAVKVNRWPSLFRTTFDSCGVLIFGQACYNQHVMPFTSIGIVRQQPDASTGLVRP